MMESKVLMSGVLIALGTMSGCYEESAPEEVVSQSINCEDRQFDWLKEYIPVESTDIKPKPKKQLAPIDASASAEFIHPMCCEPPDQASGSMI